ncbi:homoserine dehydrogenase [Benzoatithermus flavus]|uniref:Homoserine dehydrogenase n=1 Tax=Benzoatithermus flavus TaxID=3108223 RepID=A0ABU8XSH0_9PROT
MANGEKSLRIGIAGLGTVGGGTLRTLRENAELLTRRTGCRLVVTAVSARDPGRKRDLDLGGLRWHEDARALAEDPEVDLVCELIGGSDGIALELVRACLRRGRPVVTANKAMLAHHGTELARLAESTGAPLGWEAAVAGGIPIIKSLRQGLAANRIVSVSGILNGTCNFILTTMRETGREFADVLAEAQALGYAEADPSFDVDGIDAAHKLTLLASLAFGGRPRFDAVHIEGIRHVSAMDIAFAGQLGYRIKLLGVARMTAAGLEQRVHPCMVPAEAPIAQVEGVFNGVVVEGDRVGSVVHEGRGAGAGPTASAVVADIVDIARGLRLPVFGVPASGLADHPIAPMTAHRGCYYIRLMVVDQPGVLADISAVLRDHNVSIESLIQRGRNPGQAVPIVLTSHDALEADMRGALQRIGALASVLEPPRMIRIERP